MLEKIMEIYESHGFGTQHWNSDTGYTAVCWCGAEFLVGPTEAYSSPPRTGKFKELWDALDTRDLDFGERALLKTLQSEHDKKVKEYQDKHAEEQRKRMRAPILKHVRELFAEVIAEQKIGEQEDEELSVDCSKCGSKAGNRCKTSMYVNEPHGWTDRVHNARRLALDAKKKKEVAD